MPQSKQQKQFGALGRLESRIQSLTRVRWADPKEKADVLHSRVIELNNLRRKLNMPEVVTMHEGTLLTGFEAHQAGL